jgi:hypothetical protein
MASSLARNVRRIERALTKRATRAGKYLRQRRQLDAGRERRALFVVGCQRSGTNMLLEVLDRSSSIWVYEEGWRPAFVGYRLAAPDVVERLIRRSPAPLVAFKPICDSHLTDRLLHLHPGSKAVWIYRRYPDVANSAIRNWGDHQRDVVRWICAGDWARLDWRGERLSPATVDSFRHLARGDISPAEGAALFWYLRNHFYFELGLESDRRVLLVRYEDLVAQPAQHFARISEFIDSPLEPRAFAPVFPSSVNKEPCPEIDPEIRSLCDGLLARLDRCCEAQRGGRWELMGRRPGAKSLTQDRAAPHSPGSAS